MRTLRFIIAIAELLLSPAILAFYGFVPRNARIRTQGQPVLDFSPRLG